MRCVPYNHCCGAYFFCDITKESILDKNTSAEKLPKIPDPSGWTDGYPDPSKAGLAYHVLNHPNVAYFFAILKKEEKELGDLLCNEHGFFLMSKTEDRLLYCKARETKKG